VAAVNSLVKQATKALLPDSAVQRIQRELGKRAQGARQMDLRRVRLIREAPLEKLLDPAYLETDLLPSAGFNDELLHEFPASLHRHTGLGLLHWQYPNQFSKYLVELSRHRIESYLEIGVRHGGTFVITVEYLSRFHPIKEAVAVDLELNPGLRRYQKSRGGVTVMRANSHDGTFQDFVRDHEEFDLVLIDGDHSEEGCRQDFETVRDRARIVAFHDIVSDPVPGVGRVWRTVKDTYADRYEFLEFTQQYPELQEQAGVPYFGIGVAVSR
jgi:cephalosporin hydroxylase